VLVNTLVLAIITDARGEEKSFPTVFEEHNEEDGKPVQGKDLMPSVDSVLSPMSTPLEQHDKVSRPEQA
jgi:hypothetical protein